LEAYDNLFLVRTEDRRMGLLRVWYHESAEPVLEQILRDLRRETPIKTVAVEDGMTGLDDSYPPNQQ